MSVRYPLAVGIAFGGDMDQGTPLLEIVENLSKNFHMSGKRDIRRSELFVYEKWGISFTIDERCGYSPVRLEIQPQGTNVSDFKINVALQEIEGNWLPSIAVAKHGRRKSTIFFTWNSVNESVAAQLNPTNVPEEYRIDHENMFKRKAEPSVERERAMTPILKP